MTWLEIRSARDVNTRFELRHANARDIFENESLERRR